MKQLNWTKKSIFFDLECWLELKIKDITDPKHMEKNACDIIVGMTLPIKGKSKDTMNTCIGIQEMGIRYNMWPVLVNCKYNKGHANYTYKPTGKRRFLNWLQSVKFLDGYANIISRHVKRDSEILSSLKSPDCHVLLHFLLVFGLNWTTRLLR